MSVSESASELLGDALVFEYLKSRGLSRTAEVYALETKRKFPALAKEDELSAQLWVNFRQRLGINKFLRDKADERAAAAADERGESAASELAVPTLEFILKKTLRSLNSGGDGFDRDAANSASTQEQTPTDANDNDGGGGEAGMHANGSGGQSSSQLHASTSTSTSNRKKGKKKKSRKYQPPPASRNPGVNHNVQFHSLGKPAYTRRQAVTRADSDEAPTLSRESWMPMELRLKMLKRDMELAKHKMRDQHDWEYRKQKAAPKTDEHTRMKTLQKLTQRTALSRNMCALCEHDFLDLPFGVSYKAIMDLRRVWGVKVAPESRYMKYTLIPHCYETVRVCVFCSQFFGLDFFNSERQKVVGV
eukprot:INCI15079.1.p1 GENE.INCI15079.1~~INCI15079.1.p1  ORF type:complete len:361 (-),score=77.39 INCI15079.1:1322-2404(-)